MSLIGLSCIFPVPDIKRTTEFYISSFGFRPLACVWIIMKGLEDFCGKDAF